MEALHRYDTEDRDPALYAAKALESMIKIISDERKFTTGKEKGAGDYINHLNSNKNGALIIKDEKDELLSLFRIRNAVGHGPGNEPMPTLTSEQSRKFIHSAMIWISTLAKR